MLAVHNIIIVTIQYRLGYLGFFSTNDNNCIGNFGLWDQVRSPTLFLNFADSSSFFANLIFTSGDGFKMDK